MVTLYLPSEYLPAEEPRGDVPFTPHESGKIAAAQSWIYQTWLEVRGEEGIRLATEIPETGLVVALKGTLPRDFRAAPGQFVAAVVADSVPHAGAQVQIVQNGLHARQLPNSIFMPMWTQPGLKPRDPARGDRLETLAYLGDAKNLAPELAHPAWRQKLKAKTGVDFDIRGGGRWHDYSDIDCLLGIRDFSSARQIHKPAAKLHNAWLAGVPFIGGGDSAYRAERKSEYDYFEAHSPDEVIEQVQRLKTEPGLAARMREQAAVRSAECSRDAMRRRWLWILTVELPRRQAEWKGGAFFWAAQRARFWLDEKLRS